MSKPDEPTICQGCNTPVPHAPPNTSHLINKCPNCPPTTCHQCGHLDHPTNSCPCWINPGDIPPADLKALLANTGIGITTDGRWHT